jgi:NAD(P)H-dependent FMN reductase
MAQPVKILAFAGSTRDASYNKTLVRIAVAGAQAEGADVTTIDLRDYPMPLMDEDLEQREGPPANARWLKDLFLAHQGLLIASPEYNSSISPLLKNTLDWVSRPAADEPALACFAGKVAAILSASPGGLGGLRGLITVRSILSNIGVLVLPDQVTIPAAATAFTPEGQLKDPRQQASAEKIGAQLAQTIARLRS